MEVEAETEPPIEPDGPWQVGFIAVLILFYCLFPLTQIINCMSVVCYFINRATSKL